MGIQPDGSLRWMHQTHDLYLKVMRSLRDVEVGECCIKVGYSMPDLYSTRILALTVELEGPPKHEDTLMMWYIWIEQNGETWMSDWDHNAHQVDPNEWERDVTIPLRNSLEEAYESCMEHLSELVDNPMEGHV